MGARSSPTPRTLVIGDVHGCLDELRALVAKAGVTADDRVVLVGDLVSKGPDSADVDWLSARPLWLRLALAAPHVVVHGGMVAGVPVEKQEREHLLAMRSVR